MFPKFLWLLNCSPFSSFSANIEWILRFHFGFQQQQYQKQQQQQQKKKSKSEDIFNLNSSANSPMIPNFASYMYNVYIFGRLCRTHIESCDIWDASEPHFNESHILEHIPSFFQLPNGNRGKGKRTTKNGCTKMCLYFVLLKFTIWKNRNFKNLNENCNSKKNIERENQVVAGNETWN